MTWDSRIGAAVGKVVRSQNAQRRQALQHPQAGGYRGRPVPAAASGLGWNPTLVCHDVTGATTLTGGIGVDLRFTTAWWIDTDDWLEPSDDGTTTIVENISSETVWLRVACTTLWQAAGGGGQRGLYINSSGTGAGPQVLYQQQQVTTAGLKSAHSVSGLIILPPSGYLWAHASISNASSAQTVSEASLDVTIEHVGDKSTSTLILEA